jgi:NAD(P)-dependent dehydrogenase (short-subunit alcohol dehydrogenase family)
MEQITFADRVVIVTGGGGGLGTEYAHELARRGGAILVNDIDHAAADAVVVSINDRGGRAVANYSTVATPQGGREIVQSAVDAFGTVDVVINNAGIMLPGAFEDLDPDLLLEHVAVHAGGAFFVTQPAWPIMKEKKYGRVVMISSGGGIFSMHANASYGTAKGAIHALGRCLALEGAEHGIGVNMVLPNAATNMGKNNPVPGYRKYFREELRSVLAPMRVAKGVAPLIAFLASSACKVTGEAFDSTCGRVAGVFAGVNPGWVGDHVSMTAEQIQANLEQIRDRSEATVPTSLWDEYETVGLTLSVGV